MHPDESLNSICSGTAANAMVVAEAVVPGQYEYNQMVASFQSGNYGNAAGWGVTWVSSAVVGVAKRHNCLHARKPAFGRLVLRSQREKRSLELGDRYVGAKEARTISQRRNDSTGGPKESSENGVLHRRKVYSGKAAKTGLDLDSKPTHRVDFSMDHAPAGSGRLTDHGRVEFTLREGAEPVQANKLTLLNDAAPELELDMAVSFPPELDR